MTGVHFQLNNNVGWFMVFKGHFQQYFGFIVGVSFIGGGNQSTRRKTTDLPQVADKLYHIMLYRVYNVPLLSWIRTLKVSGDRH